MSSSDDEVVLPVLVSTHRFKKLGSVQFSDPPYTESPLLPTLPLTRSLLAVSNLHSLVFLLSSSSPPSLLIASTPSVLSSIEDDRRSQATEEAEADPADHPESKKVQDAPALDTVWLPLHVDAQEVWDVSLSPQEDWLLLMGRQRGFVYHCSQFKGVKAGDERRSLSSFDSAGVVDLQWLPHHRHCLFTLSSAGVLSLLRIGDQGVVRPTMRHESPSPITAFLPSSLTPSQLFLGHSDGTLHEATVVITPSAESTLIIAQRHPAHLPLPDLPSQPSLHHISQLTPHTLLLGYANFRNGNATTDPERVAVSTFRPSTSTFTALGDVVQDEMRLLQDERDKPYTARHRYGLLGVPQWGCGLLYSNRSSEPVMVGGDPAAPDTVVPYEMEADVMRIVVPADSQWNDTSILGIGLDLTNTVSTADSVGEVKSEADVPFPLVLVLASDARLHLYHFICTEASMKEASAQVMNTQTAPLPAVVSVPPSPPPPRPLPSNQGQHQATSALSAPLAAPPASTSKSFADLAAAKKASNGWDCAVCEVTNDATATQCKSCETPRDEGTVTTAPTSFALPQISFNFSTGAAAPTFSFGTAAPTTPASIFATNTPFQLPATPLPKPKEATWQFGAALPPSSTPTPSTAPPTTPFTFASSFNSAATASSFSFGGVTVAAAPPKATPAPPPPAVTGPTTFAELAARQKASDQWECAVCDVQNPPEATQCLSCEEPKPVSSLPPPKPAMLPSAPVPPPKGSFTPSAGAVNPFLPLASTSSSFTFPPSFSASSSFGTTSASTSALSGSTSTATASLAPSTFAFNSSSSFQFPPSTASASSTFGASPSFPSSSPFAGATSTTFPAAAPTAALSLQPAPAVSRPSPPVASPSSGVRKASQGAEKKSRESNDSRLSRAEQPSFSSPPLPPLSSSESTTATSIPSSTPSLSSALSVLGSAVKAGDIDQTTVATLLDLVQQLAAKILPNTATAPPPASTSITTPSVQPSKGVKDSGGSTSRSGGGSTSRPYEVRYPPVPNPPPPPPSIARPPPLSAHFTPADFHVPSSANPTVSTFYEAMRSLASDMEQLSDIDNDTLRHLQRLYHKDAGEDELSVRRILQLQGKTRQLEATCREVRATCTAEEERVEELTGDVVEALREAHAAYGLSAQRTDPKWRELLREQPLDAEAGRLLESIDAKLQGLRLKVNEVDGWVKEEWSRLKGSSGHRRWQELEEEGLTSAGLRRVLESHAAIVDRQRGEVRRLKELIWTGGVKGEEDYGVRPLFSSPPMRAMAGKKVEDSLRADDGHSRLHRAGEETPTVRSTAHSARTLTLICPCTASSARCGGDPHPLSPVCRCVL